VNAKKSSAKQPYQEPDIAKQEANFKQLKELLSDGTIVLKAYVDRCMSLYNSEPNKKYIEELEDTSESDETDDDNDNIDESDLDRGSTSHFTN
jgi:hypothetical protein